MFVLVIYLTWFDLIVSANLQEVVVIGGQFICFVTSLHQRGLLGGINARWSLCIGSLKGGGPIYSLPIDLTVSNASLSNREQKLFVILLGMFWEIQNRWNNHSQVMNWRFINSISWLIVSKLESALSEKSKSQNLQKLESESESTISQTTLYESSCWSWSRSQWSRYFKRAGIEVVSKAAQLHSPGMKLFFTRFK